MKSWRTRRFKDLYARLPADARRQTTAAYRLWKSNPRHPSLHFKLVDPADPTVYSVRIGLRYRAIGYYAANGDFLWVWIGTHAEYDKVT